MPNISVIVPVYKVEKLLDRCVESILRQTYADFELILVDDGSPDRSGEMCDAWAAKDARIRVMHKENSGQAGARNMAIDWVFANSGSQWLCFVDSDDYVHPKMLEILLNAAESAQAQISVCGLTVTNGEPLPDGEQTPQVRVVTPEEYYIKDSDHASGPCCKLYRRECFADVRFTEGKLYEDAFTLYRVLFPCSTIALVDWVGYAYYVNPGSSTRVPWSFKKLDLLETIQDQIDYFTQRGNLRMRRFMIREYMKTVVWQMEEIKQLPEGPLARKGRKLLKKTGRNTLIRYRKDKVFDKEKDGFIYMCFFPGISRIYYTAQGVFRKLGGK